MQIDHESVKSQATTERNGQCLTSRRSFGNIAAYFEQVGRHVRPRLLLWTYTAFRKFKYKRLVFFLENCD